MSNGMPPPAPELAAAESMIIPRVRHLSALDVGAFGAQLPLHVLLREATALIPGTEPAAAPGIETPAPATDADAEPVNGGVR